ncbi:hypothetical protein E2C01_004325 [Portunus trituberculatus]|uniref:Uncharacterized protein n=1 Tax=Portunus trituberculatus TaxID=210409 RepID=A0A5B7CR32_PORTR|nr:hypothetical protein [Portunus trituberculatus]
MDNSRPDTRDGCLFGTMNGIGGRCVDLCVAYPLASLGGCRTETVRQNATLATYTKRLLVPHSVCHRARLRTNHRAQGIWHCLKELPRNTSLELNQLSNHIGQCYMAAHGAATHGKAFISACKLIVPLLPVQRRRGGGKQEQEQEEQEQEQ